MVGYKDIVVGYKELGLYCDRLVVGSVPDAYAKFCEYYCSNSNTGIITKASLLDALHEMAKENPC